MLLSHLSLRFGESWKPLVGMFKNFLRIKKEGMADRYVLQNDSAPVHKAGITQE